MMAAAAFGWGMGVPGSVGAVMVWVPLDRCRIAGVAAARLVTVPAARNPASIGSMSSADGRPTVWAIVLAAGAGTRFGGGKMLAALGGRPVLQHVLDRLAAAGLADVVVVLGDDAPAVESAIDWRTERRVRNPDPGRGLSSSLWCGLDALPGDAGAALVALGDQPLVPVEAIRALLAAGVSEDCPVSVPRPSARGGRNPVLLGRAAFGLAEEATGDRGLGPVLAAHPDLVREVPIAGADGDVDTRADHVALLESAWAARVRANRDQVDRHREVPDAADFYGPVSGLFRADPTRTDDPSLEALLALVRAGDTWLDIGAGAGRYALPLARALAPSGGRVIAVDPSRGMLDALAEIGAEHGISNVEVVEARWPLPEGRSFPADVALIAHVGYDIEAIGPFVRTMESSARRLCVAALMERQPSSIADVCWPSVWGEERVALPALPEFVELLRALGRDVSVTRLDREPRGFASRTELADYLRRQLWVAEGSAADARFRAALEPLVLVRPDGHVGLRDQRPMPIGVATWTPGARR
jgi:CTP:molybdopterin cytidylyltransferase MocA/SAM-dependent methyltransferase